MNIRLKKHFVLGVIALTINLSLVQFSAATILGGQIKYLQEGVGVGDNYGFSMDGDGEILLVGAPEAQVVYLYIKPLNGWPTLSAHSATLVPSAPADGFGFQVAISGDTVVVGGRSSAHVFVKPALGWSGELTPSAGLSSSGGWFGRAVAIDDDVIVVGDQVKAGCVFCPGGAITNSGLAYIFQKPASGWSGVVSPVSTIGSPDMVEDGRFGNSVSIDGDTIVVGEVLGNGNLNTSGVAHVFVDTDGDWSGGHAAVAKLINSTANFASLFGSHVNIQGSTITIKQSYSSLYIFEKPQAGWSGTLDKEARLYGFPGSTAIVDNDRVIFGAELDYDNSSPLHSGSAVVFHKPASGWDNTDNPDYHLTASDRGQGDNLGTSVAALDGNIFAGAPEEDELGDDAGALYIFSDSVEVGIVQSSTDDPVTPGDNFSYTITLTNSDPITDATNVLVTDTLPTEVSFVSASPGCAESSGAVSCAAATLLSNGGHTSFTIEVGTAANSQAHIRNDVSASSDQPDSIGYNNHAIEFTMVNNLPEIVSGQMFSVPENSPEGTIIGTVIVSDEDINAELGDYRFPWLQDLFVIDSTTGEISVGSNPDFDYEVSTRHVLDVEASDGLLNTEVEAITINILNVNEFAPVIMPDQEFTLSAGASNGTVVASELRVSDQDAESTFQGYAIMSGNTGNAFAIDPDSGSITVNDSNSLSGGTVYDLGIVVSDGELTSEVEEVSITVSAVVSSNTGANSNTNSGSGGGGGGSIHYLFLLLVSVLFGQRLRRQQLVTK